MVDKRFVQEKAKAPDIIEAAQIDGSFTIFVELAQKAGLEWVLKSNGQFTVYAPMDEAFTNLPAGVLDKLKDSSNIDSLRVVLEYHVKTREAPQTVSELLAAKSFPSWGGTVYTTSQPVKKVCIYQSDDSLLYATFIKDDLIARNGYLHGVDSVLIPDSLGL